MSMVFRDGSRTVNAGPWPGGGSQGGGAFRPGQAQPRQPQQQGTPYGQPFNYSQWMQQGQPEGQSQAWQQAGSPENGQQSQTGGFNYGEWLTSPDRHSEQKQAAWRAAGSPRGRPGGGMQSYAQQPGFTQTMQTPYGQMAPSQYYQQRDAFIQTANDQMGQYMANAGTGQSPGPPPQFNMQQMWGQAGQMVEQGWQNPYSQQQAPQQQAPVYSGDFALRRDPNMPSEPPPPGYEWARSKKGTYSLKRVSPGMAQPIPPQSQGTPYGDLGMLMPDPTPLGPAPPQSAPPPPQASPPAAADPFAYLRGKPAEHRVLSAGDAEKLPFFGQLSQGDTVTFDPRQNRYIVYDYEGIDRDVYDASGRRTGGRSNGSNSRRPRPTAAPAAAGTVNSASEASRLRAAISAEQSQAAKARQGAAQTAARGTEFDRMFKPQDFDSPSQYWGQRTAWQMGDNNDPARVGRGLIGGQLAFGPRQQPAAAAQANQKWLNSLSPDNRRIYGLMQRMR